MKIRYAEDMTRWKRYSIYAVVSGVILFLSFVMIFIGFLLHPSMGGVGIGIFVLLCLIRWYASYRMKQYRPPAYYLFSAGDTFTYRDMVKKLSLLCGGENHIKVTDEVAVGILQDSLNYRLLFVGLSEFDKERYDALKKRAIARALQSFGQEQHLPFRVAAKTMRINLIVAESFTESFEKYVSRYPERNLARSEAVLTVGLVGNRLYIPALRHFILGNDFKRYLLTVQFLNRLIDGEDLT